MPSFFPSCFCGPKRNRCESNCFDAQPYMSSHCPSKQIVRRKCSPTFCYNRSRKCSQRSTCPKPSTPKICYPRPSSLCMSKSSQLCFPSPGARSRLCLTRANCDSSGRRLSPCPSGGSCSPPPTRACGILSSSFPCPQSNRSCCPSRPPASGCQSQSRCNRTPAGGSCCEKSGGRFGGGGRSRSKKKQMKSFLKEMQQMQQPCSCPPSNCSCDMC